MPVNGELERGALQLLWDETQALGAQYGLKLLQRHALEATDFTGETPRRLFSELTKSVAAGRVPVLRGDDSEAREYLASEELRNPSHLDAMAEGLRAASVRRSLAAAAREIYRLTQEQELDAPELVARAKKLIASAPARTSTWESLQPALERVEAHIRGVAEGSRSPTVPTGFKSIDAETGGLPATLIVILAMPGVGKSAWVGSIIRNIAERGDKVALFSMEDASDWLVFRFLAKESGVHQGALRRHPLRPEQWDRVGAASGKIRELARNVLVDDRESLSPAEVLSAARDAIANRGARAVFLDNMTAMRLPRGDRRDLEFQDFLVQARAMSNETGVPFVVISHAKRREGLDVDSIPLLTDAAESSAYEKLCRLAYGLSRSRKDNALTVAVLKNTNGKAWTKFQLGLHPDSALVEEERTKSWDWSREVEAGDGRL